MFERLTGKLFDKLLSKYFTEESLTRNKISKSTQLGVWSGYLSLKNLELKKDVINNKLRSKGQPFEISHLSFQQVEITIPWAKLSNPINSSAGGSKEDDVAVFVADGVHLLVRTSFEFHDLALREEEIRQRRKAFTKAGSFAKVAEKGQKMSYTEMFKKRITDGLLQEINDKLHFHLRDLHLRVEDTDSDPQNPFAFGITIESVHIQHDEGTSSPSGIISKVAQLNHFAIYWNALEYGNDSPVENSVLHQTCRNDNLRLCRSLNFCIARRGGDVSSPSRKAHIPTHTYLLLPVNGTLHADLSTSPKDLRFKPALEAVFAVDAVSTQIRDFQCTQMLSLLSEVKNHRFVKKYRKFRPLVAVKDDPRAWWVYAARVIRYQLKETYLRWSWSRFEEGYQTRGRYMQLYERKLRFSRTSPLEKLSQLSNDVDEFESVPAVDENGSNNENLDEYGGLGVPLLISEEKRPLTEDELLELQNLEDGIYGNLSIGDIILFQALVNMRLGEAIDATSQDVKKTSWWRSTVESVARDDAEAKVELDRLLLYLDESEEDTSSFGSRLSSQTAISVVLKLKEVCVSFLSPLDLTSEETQLRRIQEQFLELMILDIRIGCSLKGDFKTADFQFSIFDLAGTEIRADRSHHIIAKQVSKGSRKTSNDSYMERADENEPLLTVNISKNPPSTSNFDLQAVAVLNCIEFVLTPDCQWVTRTMELKKQLIKLPNVAKFWEEMTLAYVNSLALGRLGLLAKAESAADEHKKMDIDIKIECPILRIGFGAHGDLIVDLGSAHFKTQKLAGVAENRLNHRPLLEVLESNSTERLPAVCVDDLSVTGALTTVSPITRRRKPVRYKQLSATSSLSFDSKNMGEQASRSLTGSIYQDDAMSFANESTGRMKTNKADKWHAVFYDVYQLRQQTGKIVFSGETSRFEISNGFEINTTFKKSIIPSDHTLCKLKSHTAVGNLKFVLNENVISSIGEGISRWKRLFASSSSELDRVKSHSMTSSNRLSVHKSSVNRIPRPFELDISEEASLSQIDEGEFFDAIGGYDSVAEEDSTIWFEDNWITDAESVISDTSYDRRGNRRQPSISDVSSASDQSIGHRGQRGNAYLSAENLARLEEGVTEDESLVENGIDTDDESFHSVLSNNGQLNLLLELEEDIKKAENNITTLEEKLVSARRATKGVVEASHSDQKRRRIERRSIKVDLDREEAALKALRALHSDLKQVVSDSFLINGDTEHESLNAIRMETAKNAKAILEAKKRRDSMFNTMRSHNLTRNLNRELFQGSIQFNQLQIVVELDEAVDEKASSEPLSAFEFIASQTGLMLYKYANDTKIYFSSDQITAAVRNMANSRFPTRVLLSGGSGDTLLPSHFPHLLSHSMEERFLRGTLYLGKHRAIESSSKAKETRKLRVILGDIEMSPCQEFLNPLVSVLLKVRSRHTGAAEVADKSHPLSQIASSSISKSHHNPLAEPLPKQPTRYFDLAFRLTSVRVILSLGSQVVGACALSETSARLVQASSFLRNRCQVDIRCNNFQLLEITSLEAGRGSEIIGRRDPYSALVSVRLRTQLVPAHESGGWVIGIDESQVERENIPREKAVRNVHLGVKFNPISFVASPDALSNIIDCSRELKAIKASAQKISSSEKPPLLHRLSGVIPLRWRIDFSLRKITIHFPDQVNEAWNGSDDFDGKMIMNFIVVASLQESTMKPGFLSLRMGLTDISLFRPSDEWPIFEYFSIIGDLCIERNLFGSDISSIPSVLTSQLRLPVESPLNEIAAVLHRHGWDSIPKRRCADAERCLIAKITPVRANFSAQIISLLIDTAVPLKSVLSKLKKKDYLGKVPSTGSSSRGATSKRHRVGLQINLEDMEWQLLQEAESKPITSAEPLFSFALTDVTVEYEEREQTTASVLIRNSALFDLSSSRGVRVLGKDPRGDTDDNPYFVRAKLYIDNLSDGPRTIRFEINWGRIQCLVMPSFVTSILLLKDDVKAILGTIGSKSNGSHNNTVMRYLNLPKDTNLLFSAHAEAFECILSSKDIIQYVRRAETEPIGVVSFRWKASLTVGLALDCLQESSVPWVTLNIDGNFTDQGETGLFKAFTKRYLAQSSGFLAASEEIGHKLVNAFTGRVNLVLSNFQALRTNISLHKLNSSSQAVGLSYKSTHRVYFAITPPSAGEQIITNPIDMDMTYRVVGTTMSKISNFEEMGPPRVEISQLLKVKANFVDVLLYISKGTEGFTRAISVTVKPILDFLKRKKEGRRPKDQSDEQKPNINVEKNRALSPTLETLLRNSSSMCTIQLEGFQLTFVPGGATRLNESPIIKFELSSFASGLAAVPVPKHTNLMASRSRSRQNGAPHLLSGVDVMHLTFAGWVACEITAHYHNRRLVAWEPFIEPWVADVRFGADFVEAFRIPPCIKAEGGELKSRVGPQQSGLDPFTSGPEGGTSDRLRDFGRLFRAPFQSGASSKPSQTENLFFSHADLSYLMLASTTRSTILSVLYPTSDHADRKESSLFSLLPGRSPIEWLYSFGFPLDSGRESRHQYAISCSLTDVRPLNINLTGALIENVLGYLSSVRQSGFKTVAPHWIRNDTGMTIRLREVPDIDRVKMDEKVGSIKLENGSEVPLTLKRSLSQTCDPHRAYIYLELGSFEDLVGRIKLDDFDIPKGSRSTSYFFKVAAKIPVDTVGVHRYPLDRNVETRVDLKSHGTDSRALGWIIVRVALKGGTKVVSVESPFVLKSMADSDLLCEFREHNGLSLLWRCLIPRSEGQRESEEKAGIVPIPADIVPLMHDGSYSFSVVALSREFSLSHEAEFGSFTDDKAIEISTPPPFSPLSFNKGLIEEEEIALSAVSPETPDNVGLKHSDPEKIHLTVCSVRIGSFTGVKATMDVPEQRMLFVRSPLVIKNFLALPIAVQVRVDLQSNAATNVTTSGKVAPDSPRDQKVSRRSTVFSVWKDLGVLDCGQSVNWTGAFSSDKVQLRVRFVGTDGDNSRRFPGWSSAVNVPARDKSMKGTTRKSRGGRTFAQMRVLDADNVPLHLSVSLGSDIGNSTTGSDSATGEDIRLFSDTVPTGTKVVNIFVPYWIIDSTNEDLEFFSGAPVAGQLDNRLTYGKDFEKTEDGTTLGLAELLDNDNFLHIPSRSSFEVMMIGDESSTRLTVRKRLTRMNRRTRRQQTSPWSDPVPLKAEQNSQYDITVLAPQEYREKVSTENEDPRTYDRFVIRSNMVNAPERFGGLLGTKLIHIVNRYSIVNEIGRDIEIASENGQGGSVLVRAAGWPQPFHFDDSRPIRFRFKEFGWVWSGKFTINLNRREVTMRLRHKMKGHTVIVTVEVLEKTKSPTSLLVFRQSSHPPFRLENHTMYPLHFGQSSKRIGSADSDADSMLLPYQSADFAWDEPELRRRILLIKAADSADFPNGFVLGRFHLDRIAPGTELKPESTHFLCKVIADGPTRVLRIANASMPRSSTFRQDDLNDFQQKSDVNAYLAVSLLVKLAHGIGVSIVDWSPREILYARLDDIHIERKNNSRKVAVNMAVGSIQLNNQLWVTPYPVLLKMGRRPESSGSRRRNRRHDAITLSWRRSLNTAGTFGNVTLLEKVELSSEPINVNVDGQLSGLLIRMMRHVAEIGSDSNRKLPATSRDEELRKMLDLAESDAPSEAAELPKKTFRTFEHDGDGELMTTAAIAAKLRTRPLPLVKAKFEPISGKASRGDARKEKKDSLAKLQHKYYIEKLRVSTTKVDLSWSGALPGLDSYLLFRAVRFERFPLRLRQYSSSHAYGSAKDHLQAVKSHYVSLSRIVDLLMGLSYNPTFLFRAVIYTFRESCVSILDSWSATSKKTAEAIGAIVLPKEMEFQPMYDDGLPLHEGTTTTFTLLKRAAFGPFLRSTAGIMHRSSAITAWMASLLKYNSHSSGSHLSTRGLVRSRTPRLFAHMDGKDLLVEYVEGENSGKALLSRVRMGVHLGEGYIFHTEEARQRKIRFKAPTDLDPEPLIFMVTLERVLLLGGKLDRNFCEVIWESMFLNIIYVELIVAEETTSSPYDQIIIWYLSDRTLATGNNEEISTTYATALVSGIDVLKSKSVFVPEKAGKLLLAKMGNVEKRIFSMQTNRSPSKVKTD